MSHKQAREMTNQQPRDGSIALRVGEDSEREDRAGHKTGPKDDKPTAPMWAQKIFIGACAFAVLLDPLSCYLPVIDDKKVCYYWDESLMWTFIGLRSFLDLFCAVFMFVYLRPGTGKGNANMSHMADDECNNGPKYGTFVILVAPIPQVAIFIGKYGWSSSTTGAAFFLISVTVCLAQYTYRASYTFLLIKPRPDIKTSRWLQATLNFLPFLIASHILGALWLFFAVERKKNCWEKTYNELREFKPHFQYSFYCGEINTAKAYKICNMTNVKASCSINPEDDNTIFDFGIYQYALQSNFTKSKAVRWKILHCFWWGLRNLSSYGSNLETSFYWIENIFSVLICTSGLALFLIYLNTMLQVSQKRSHMKKSRQKMQMMTPDIDLWLSRNYLSGSNGELKKLKESIKKTVQQKLEENKDVDVHNFFSLLPTVHKRQIMSLASLKKNFDLSRQIKLFKTDLTTKIKTLHYKKAPMFENMNIRVWKEIAKHLEPVSFNKSCYIIREEEPLWNVLFITHGTALSYKTSTSGSSNIKWLEKDDFFGDELLDWAFVFASDFDLPVSPKTVMAQTRVEGFAISAYNLKRVVSKCRLHFILNFPDLKDSPLEHKAASFLQAKWQARANRSTKWNKLRELYLIYSSKSD